MKEERGNHLLLRFLCGAFDAIRIRIHEVNYIVFEIINSIIMHQKNTPNNKARVAYQLLQDVTHHIVSWAKPGMRMCELDAEARRMLGEYSEYFTHSLGH